MAGGARLLLMGIVAGLCGCSDCARDSLPGGAGGADPDGQESIVDFAMPLPDVAAPMKPPEPAKPREAVKASEPVKVSEPVSPSKPVAALQPAPAAPLTLAALPDDPGPDRPDRRGGCPAVVGIEQAHLARADQPVPRDLRASGADEQLIERTILRV